MPLPKSHPFHGIPNLGPAMARDLERLGVRDRADLARQDPDALYLRISRMDGRLHDPCVWDTYAAIIDFANGGEARPWWDYTPERKKRQADGRFPRL